MKLIELEELINQFKVLKSDIVYLRGQNIFGFDNTFTIVKETQFINPYSHILVIQIKEWLDLFKNLKEANVKYENKEIDLINSEYISYKGKNYYYKSGYIIRTFDEKIYNIYNIITNTQANIMIDDMRKDDKFAHTLDKEFKSGDGAYLYRIQEYSMSIYKTLLGITSKDNIALDIYDSEILYFTARFTLKNKVNNTYIYLHLRKLP